MPFLFAQTTLPTGSFHSRRCWHMSGTGRWVARSGPPTFNNPSSGTSENEKSSRFYYWDMIFAKKIVKYEWLPFQAYPTCFSHTHIPSLLASLKRVKAFKDVALSGQLGVGLGYGGCRLAVRVRVVPYPYQLCAVWIIVASCSQKGVWTYAYTKSISALLTVTKIKVKQSTNLMDCTVIYHITVLSRL